MGTTTTDLSEVETSVNAGPTSITVLTGFLGAGKTTLLNHILTTSNEDRVAVVVNDFGAINVDARLVVAVEGQTVRLSNGCVCCALRDDLVTETARLLTADGGFDHVIVETSGVADPRPVVDTFLNSDLDHMARIDGVIALVDSEQVLDLAGDDGRLAAAQVEAADLVVLNKADLVSPVQLDAVGAWVDRIVPGARRVAARFGRVPLGILLGSASPSATSIGANEHVDYRSWSWSSDRPLRLASLREAIRSLPPSIYRAKGVVQLRDYPQYEVELQLTGRRSTLSARGFWDTTAPASEIVLIGSPDASCDEVLERLDAATLDTNEGAPPADWRRILETPVATSGQRPREESTT